MRPNGRKRLIVAGAFALVLLLVFISPTLWQDRTKIREIGCQGRLRSLGQLAMAYAIDHRDFLPVASGDRPRAFESLQLLVDWAAARSRFDPKILVCPASGETPAAADPSGKFRLTEKNVSYAWIARPLRIGGGSSAKTMIACDYCAAHHPRGISVLYLDSSVAFLKWEDMEKRFGAGYLDAFLEANHLAR